MLTSSICPKCFKEIPATLSIEGDSIFMGKSCCGETKSVMVERSASFSREADIHRGQSWTNLPVCLLEVTHRCNNKCKNCYHSEDHGLAEPTLEELVSRTSAIPVSAICLIGGEPTVRNDLPEIIKALAVQQGRMPVMYTNGIRLADKEYLKSIMDAGLLGLAFSLHHPEYSSPKVLEKKRQALDNIKEAGLPVEHIAFSMAHEGQIPGILDEIERYAGFPMSFRIRSGYSPENQRWFVSDLYKLVKAEADRRGKSFEFYPKCENTRYQVGFTYDGIKVWLMSWPSNHTIDLAHARGFPCASFTPGVVQHFCRAVVTQEGLRRGWFNGVQLQG